MAFAVCVTVGPAVLKGMEPTVSFNAEKQRLIRAVKEKKNAAAWAAFLHFERAHTTDWPRILTLHNNALKLASASPVDEHSLSLRIGRAEVLMYDSDTAQTFRCRAEPRLAVGEGQPLRVWGLSGSLLTCHSQYRVTTARACVCAD